MASVRGLAKATGFSRDALTLRLERFGLGADFDAKDVLLLRPLDDANPNLSEMEAARIRQMTEDANLKQVQRQEKEGVLVRRDHATKRLAQMAEVCVRHIRGSSIPETEKEDILDSLHAFDKWPEE